MLKATLCDYSDTYILVSGTITVAALAADGGNNGIEVALKVAFTDWISEMNNTQIGHAKDLVVAMSTYNY